MAARAITAALALAWTTAASGTTSRPNIVVSVVDDLGFADVSYHDAAQVTPEVARMARHGVTLERFYTGCACTPSRTMLMTGRYTIRSGMQDSVLHSTEPRGVALEEAFLPQKLQVAGYSTYGVGKWHLGMFQSAYLPTRRGFDRWFGMYPGGGSHTGHFSVSQSFTVRGDVVNDEQVWMGYNLFEDEMPVNDTLIFGEHSTPLYTEKAVEYVSEADDSKPFFLYLAYQAVHDPMEVGDPERYVRDTACVNSSRPTLCGMVAEVDDGLASVRRAVEAAGRWNETVFVVLSDNGGVPSHGSSNWPLRGGKGTYYEGGVRVPAVVAGGLVESVQRQNRVLGDAFKFHLVDLHATLLHVAGYDDDAVQLDGTSFWHDVVSGARSPPSTTRREDRAILINVNSELFGGSGAVIVGDYKLLVNGDPKEIAIYEKVRSVLAETKTDQLTLDTFHAILNDAHTSILGANASHELYDVVSNPSEIAATACAVPRECQNLYGLPAFAAVQRKLVAAFHDFQSQAVASSFAWEDDGPLADPRLFDGYWSPWRDASGVPAAYYPGTTGIPGFHHHEPKSSNDVVVTHESVSSLAARLASSSSDPSLSTGLLLVTLVAFCAGALAARLPDSVRRGGFTRLP